MNHWRLPLFLTFVVPLLVAADIPTAAKTAVKVNDYAGNGVTSTAAAGGKRAIDVNITGGGSAVSLPDAALLVTGGVAVTALPDAAVLVQGSVGLTPGSAVSATQGTDPWVVTGAVAASLPDAAVLVQGTVNAALPDAAVLVAGTVGVSSLPAITGTVTATVSGTVALPDGSWLNVHPGNGTDFYESVQNASGHNYLGVAVMQDSEISVKNSSTANINAGASFTGTAESTLGYGAIKVNTFVNQPITVNVQQSMDGTNWDIGHTYTLLASTGDGRVVECTASYYRIVVTNTGLAATTVVRIQTRLAPVASALPRHLLSINEKQYLATAMVQHVNPSLYNNYFDTVLGQLAAGATWTGGKEDTLGVAGLQIEALSDQPLQISLQQSLDGTNWDLTDTYTRNANQAGGRTFQAVGSHFRITIKNTGAGPTTFLRAGVALCPVVETVPRALSTSGNLQTAVRESPTMSYNLDHQVFSFARLFTITNVEVPHVLIRNPANSGRDFMLTKVNVGLPPDRAVGDRATATLYVNPTVNDGGTAAGSIDAGAPLSRNQKPPVTASLMKVGYSPVNIIGFGSMVTNWNSTGTSQVIDEINSGVIIGPGQDLLLTLDGSGNITMLVTLVWTEFLAP